jgi:hypothetical protein
MNLGGQASEEVVLKACPFCGGAAEYFERYQGLWNVHCTASDCGATIDPTHRDHDDCVRAWNTRHPSGDTGEIARWKAKLLAVATERDRLAEHREQLLEEREQQAPTIAELRGHIAEQITHVETRIQDGKEMGAAVWRIALEDVARENRATLERTKQP